MADSAPNMVAWWNSGKAVVEAPDESRSSPSKKTPDRAGADCGRERSGRVIGRQAARRAAADHCALSQPAHPQALSVGDCE